METWIALGMAQTLIRKHCPEYRFKWTRATTTFGSCDRWNKIIELSKPLTRLNEEEHVKDTILHEIAHALTKGGHNKGFYRMCRILGAKPERCYDSKEVVTPPRNIYLYECINCHREVERHGKVKKRRACSECCNKYNFGRFSEEYELFFQGVIRK